MKKKILIVVDMQNDFITGALKNEAAQAIIPAVKAKIDQVRDNGGTIVFTRDSHGENYMETQEGRKLPVPHCIAGTKGHEIVSGLQGKDDPVVDKPTFGDFTIGEKIVAGYFGDVKEVELCGVCTDICVVSNALILKAKLPEFEITVDAACCAGITVESHNAALLTMKMCQVNVVND